jgi:lipopolysaccharide export system permease protein
MKILDKYIAKNFLLGYAIAFFVLIGMRIIIDLFMELDEFTEHTTEIGVLGVLKNILIFYGLNTTLYFRDFAGMIAVVAAAFSLAKMVRLNELVAIMASGVSLKRVIGPIVLLSLLLTGLLVIDQEFIIPSLSNKLVREHDDVPGQERYDVWYIDDSEGSLICSQKFDVETSTLYKPTIIIRRKNKPVILEVAGQIIADKAVDIRKTGQWLLTNGYFIAKNSIKGPQPISVYNSSVTARDIPVRCESEHKNLLSWRQLVALAAQAEHGVKITDLRQLYSQKHFRITEPIINLAMLMVCLPILVCRDPKSMKSAVMISFFIVGMCFVTTFVCKMFAPEANSFYQIGFWAWLPVFIFLPTAFIELDLMKT